MPGARLHADAWSPVHRRATAPTKHTIISITPTALLANPIGISVAPASVPTPLKTYYNRLAPQP